MRDILSVLEHDDVFGNIAEEIRAEREAAGLNPDTGKPFDEHTERRQELWEMWRREY